MAAVARQPAEQSVEGFRAVGRDATRTTKATRVCQTIGVSDRHSRVYVEALWILTQESETNRDTLVKIVKPDRSNFETHLQQSMATIPTKLSLSKYLEVSKNADRLPAYIS